MAAIKNRGRAGLAGALVLSFIASFLLLAPVVYLLYFYFFFLIHPLQKDTCQRTSTAPNLSLLFENANSFYLRPAPVTEWVSELWEVFFFFFPRAAVGVRPVAHLPRAESVSGVAVCRCVLGNCAFSALFTRAVCRY